jgi:hypothetical protein
MHDQIYDNICRAIGKTPVVRLNRIPQKGWPEMLVKLESFMFETIQAISSPSNLKIRQILRFTARPPLQKFSRSVATIWTHLS